MALKMKIFQLSRWPNIMFLKIELQAGIQLSP